MSLTEHFTIQEMSHSETAIRHGLDNEIPEQLLPNVQRVAEALEKIRAFYDAPIHVTSCYRGPQVNKAVGGSLTSAHMFAMAADFEVSGQANIDVCREVAELIPDFDQIIYEFGSKDDPSAGWIHIGFTRKEPRKQLLTAIKRGGKTVYLPGIQEV